MCNLNMSDVKGTGKSLPYSVLNITISHSCEMQVSGDHCGTDMCQRNKLMNETPSLGLMDMLFVNFQPKNLGD